MEARQGPALDSPRWRQSTLLRLADPLHRPAWAHEGHTFGPQHYGLYDRLGNRFARAPRHNEVRSRSPDVLTAALVYAGLGARGFQVLE